MDKDLHHVVYVVQHKDWPKYTKIGSTDNFTTRLATLNTGSPTGIKVIYQRSFKDYQRVEKMMHSKYQKFRRNGEWFELTPEQVLDVIMTLDELDEGD